LNGNATANEPGFAGLGFSFDGTNRFVRIPDTPALRPANLTIEAWVNFGALNSALSGSAPAGSQYLVFKQNSRASFFEGYALEKYRMPKGDVFLFIVASSSSQEVCYDCPLRLSLSPRALLSPARFVTRPALLRGD